MATQNDDRRPRSTPAGSARSRLADQGAAILAEQVELARIPAPPFAEADRARAIAGRLTALRLAPEFDTVGNLRAWFPRDTRPAGPPVIIAAHVDTVFGPEVNIDIRRQGDLWLGPGITDNARGLAVCLAVLRALCDGDLAPNCPLLFVFTVGEEGPGDLRGVKHLFGEGSPLRDAAAFIAVDGSGLRRIIHHALGSRRFRFSVRGPGGHSWTDWGRVNPAIAVAGFIQRLVGIELPSRPRTTLTVARMGGGTSINAIPCVAWVELDLRSEESEAIRLTESRLHQRLDDAVAAEQQRGDGQLSIEREVIGERPAGMLATAHPLVRLAEQASRGLGAFPELTTSSTDANVPMALGIPSIAIGGGGESGETHSENEWFRDSDGAQGALRLFDILAALSRF